MFQAALQAWTNVWLPSGALAIEETERVAFTAESLEVKFCQGHRFVGGFVGSHAMHDRWVEPMVADWENVPCGFRRIGSRRFTKIQAALFDIM